MSKQTVLITGGSGGLAKSFISILEKDYEVYAPSRKELDVSNLESILNFFASHFSSISLDVLINNAGTVHLEKTGEMTPANIKDQINSNLTGALLCTNEAVKRGAHTVINIGSTAGCESFYPGYATYSATKAGLIAHVKVLHSEGIKAACISPARVDTPFRSKVSKDKEAPITLIRPETIALTLRSLLDNDGPWGAHITLSKPKLN